MINIVDFRFIIIIYREYFMKCTLIYLYIYHSMFLYYIIVLYFYSNKYKSGIKSEIIFIQYTRDT